MEEGDRRGGVLFGWVRKGGQDCVRQYYYRHRLYFTENEVLPDLVVQIGSEGASEPMVTVVMRDINNEWGKMDIRLCSSRNDREEAAAAMKNKFYYIPQATEKRTKDAGVQVRSRSREKERKKETRKKERKRKPNKQCKQIRASSPPSSIQTSTTTTTTSLHRSYRSYHILCLHLEHWYHACDKTALQTETAAVVYPLPSRRLRPQSPTAASPPSRGLAQHHRPDAVTLVAQPAPASQGCGMGVVSSVRHLGPRYYTGCMLSTALSVRDLSVCTQLSTHIHNISPDY